MLITRNKNLHGVKGTEPEFTRSKIHGAKLNSRNGNTRRRVRKPCISIQDIYKYIKLNKSTLGLHKSNNNNRRDLGSV